MIALFFFSLWMIVWASYLLHNCTIGVLVKNFAQMQSFIKILQSKQFLKDKFWILNLVKYCDQKYIFKFHIGAS